MIKSVIKKALGLFIIFSPFTSYFAISSWLRLPVLLLLGVFIIFSIKILYRKKIPKRLIFSLDSSDIILLFLFISITASVIINGKGLNHLLAYGFSFFMYFVFLKKIIDFEKIPYLFILRMFAISAFICGVIIILDWTLINFFSIGFRKYFVTVDHRISNMLYFTKGYFITVGGVAEEPGSMAILINIIFPLGLLYTKLKARYGTFLLLLTIYILSLFCLFSVAGIVGAFISSAIVIFFHFINTKQTVRIKARNLFYLLIISTILLLTSTYVFIRYFDTVKNTLAGQIKDISNKVFLSDEDMSADLRHSTWNSAISNWQEHPIWGNGPGDGINRYGSGYHSVYLTLLADTGIISFIFFLFFLFFLFLKLNSIPVLYRNYLFIGYFSSIIHFAVIGDFYHAPFWLLLLTINLIYKNENIHSHASV